VKSRLIRFDTTGQFGKDEAMSRSAQKIIAMFFAVWLPLFSGSALAASVTMRMPAGHCQDESMQMAGMDMGDMDMSVQQMPAAADQHHPACNACSVCHLACTGYLAVPGADMFAAQTRARDITPYLLAFSSFTSAPLLPPPLARV
jgi:hypothetical protein